MFNPYTFSTCIIKVWSETNQKTSISNNEGGGIFNFSFFPVDSYPWALHSLTYFLLHVEGRNGSSSCVHREISVTLINTLTLVTHTSGSRSETNIKTVMVICHRRNLLICFYLFLDSDIGEEIDRYYTFTRVTTFFFFFPVIGTKNIHLLHLFL